MSEARHKARWREIAVVLIALAVALIWGLLSPDLRRDRAPEAPASEAAE